MVNDEILIYAPEEGKEGRGCGALQGAKLAMDEAKAFSSLMKMNGKLH